MLKENLNPHRKKSNGNLRCQILKKMQAYIGSDSEANRIRRVYTREEECTERTQKPFEIRNNSLLIPVNSNMLHKVSLNSLHYL